MLRPNTNKSEHMGHMFGFIDSVERFLYIWYKSQFKEVTMKNAWLRVLFGGI